MPRNAPEIRVRQAAAGTALALAAETVIMQIDGISTQDANEDVIFLAVVTISTGVGTTALRLRLRRGTLVTDPEVESQPQQVAGAGQDVLAVGRWRDNPGNVASQSYVLTGQATGATANGNTNRPMIMAIIGAQSD